MAQFLYQTIEALEQAGFLQDMPDFIEQGLSERIELRDYQRRAFRYFITYYENENLRKNKQIHTLFHMATGSGYHDICVLKYMTLSTGVRMS